MSQIQLTYSFYFSAKIEINYDKFAIGINSQLPVKENFAEGQTELKLRGLVHLTLAL
jgi:hypothetical protein